MNVVSFDDIVMDTPVDFFQRREFCESWQGDILENTEGNSAFFPEYIIINTEARRVIMSIDFSKPPSLGVLIGICLTMLCSIGLIGWAFYSMTHTDISEIRTELSSTKDGAGDAVDKLRQDNKQDFNRLSDKLDMISSKLDAKIEKTSEKTDAKLDKINESLDLLRAKQ
ncbi:hypothetical protein PNF54_003563 [Cronobacter sakazakii]|nr:hypothetical protein [Cronobacter sakazakii]ELY6004112.1 hypothetical protein [Cronobacter sakazakii]